MSKEQKLVPQLRFPEFVKEGEWKIEPLGNLSQEIIEKTKGRKFKLMSITSGIGLVSQIEKFGREIAGDSYKNYYVIHKGDFAYNKSSTKLYAEGEIAMFEDEQTGAVPNSIFTCFRFDEKLVYPTFAKYPFANNLHGNWLRKFIAVGARANGALQVNSTDLFSAPFPHPSLTEQQRIAACLSSLDELKAAHTDKLQALKDHKKCLMKNLFPQEGETVPKYRFPEFENDGEWVEKTLGEICEMQAGKFVSASEINERFLDGLFPCYGGNGLRGYTSSFTHYGKYSLIGRQGALCGNVTLADGTFHATEHAVVVKHNDGVDTVWLFYVLVLLNLNQYATGQAQPGLSVSNLEKVELSFPENIIEQQKIASCLSSLDALINAQAEKIEQLQQHKKGLVQGLFPKMNG
ncbi:MAG: restriction endonuclease subunit S [Imperialibacter sp.]|uniref:restriction endonuclease subunit S n=1 Tax=Imperialibacter sp. TaxID=2038411 RepID=UPI0032EB2101